MIQYQFKSANTLSEAIQNLYEILSLLRSPDGCPWDRVQTNKDITECILDETYEYLDGVLKNSVVSEKEEIGDVLMNVLMNLRIHEEQSDFLPHEAINDVCEKLVRRHPHVFEAEEAHSVDDVLLLWNSVKEKVEGHTLDSNTIFSHIPGHLPQLMESYEIQKKLEKKS